MTHPREQFISEEIVSEPGTADARSMARGEPGLPTRFTWRGRQCAVAAVLRAWKSSSPEGGRAGGEMYVRRHWYEVATESGETMTLYCERQPRSRQRAKSRWWLYTLVEGDDRQTP